MYKTKNTGTGNGVREPGESYILGTDAKHSVKYRQAFWIMSPNILQNSSEDSGKSKFRFTSWNLACFFIKFFYCHKTMKKNKDGAILLKKTFSTLILITNLLSLIYCFSELVSSFPFPFLFLWWGKRVITVRRGRGLKKL